MCQHAIVIWRGKEAEGRCFSEGVLNVEANAEGLRLCPEDFSEFSCCFVALICTVAIDLR